MKTFPRPLPQLLASIFGLLLLAFPLTAKEEHPAMHDASEALRAAQGAADPVAQLQKARRALVFAENNKQGNRLQAIKLTDRALAATKAGKRVEANKAISEALNLIEKGVALHPRDKRRR